MALLIILMSLMTVTAYRGHYLDDDPREAADMIVSWCRLYETEGRERYLYALAYAYKSGSFYLIILSDTAWSENLGSALDGTRVRVILVSAVLQHNILVYHNITRFRL